jgi:hypothetical protein
MNGQYIDQISPNAKWLNQVVIEIEQNKVTKIIYSSPLA